MNAEDLRIGEQVQRLDGSYGVVVALRHLFGVAVRYNLTVAEDHTYAVGAAAVVVHNTDDVGCGGGSGNSPDDPADADTILKKMHEGEEKVSGVGDKTINENIYATTDEADKAARTYVAEGGEESSFRENTAGYSVDENNIRRQYRYDMDERSHGDAPHINLEYQLPKPTGGYNTVYDLHIYLTDWLDD